MAGIKPTDIIVEIDDHEIVEAEDIIVVLQDKQKDDIFVFPHIGENKVFVDSFVINLKFNCL